MPISRHSREASVSSAAQIHGFHSGAKAIAQASLAERAAFEASLTLWLPRVYAFASARLSARADAEAVTRATLEIAAREGALAAGERAAPRMLCIVKAQLALRRSPEERS
jgi:hypothetical protein